MLRGKVANKLLTESSSIGSVNILASHIQRSRLLSEYAGLVHGITRRVPGAGLADGNVGYSAPRDRDDAWSMRQLWMHAAGLSADKIVVSYQTHGNDVFSVGPADAGRGSDPVSKPAGHADALIISESGVVAMTLHADCMPVILYDPDRRIAATIHAGWRGTVADVVGATVRRMQDDFAAEPSSIIAYLGPAIGGCCYEVGDDVASAWAEHQAEAGLQPLGDRWLFDLAVANSFLLERVGLVAANIETSGICTKCQGDEWFSHRGQGAATGRYGSFISLTA